MKSCGLAYLAISDDGQIRRNLFQCSTFHSWLRRMHGGRSSFAVTTASEPAMAFLEFETAAAGTTLVAITLVGNHPPHALARLATAGAC